MLRKIRIVLAALFFVGTTLLFLDFTGVAHEYLGWMAKIQLWPAIIALNIAVVAGLLLLTLVLGRVYCSVICPLGVLQDIINWLRARIGGKKTMKKRQCRHSYSPAKNWLRYGVLVVFVAMSFVGLSYFIAPYSAYGTIAVSIFRPVYIWGNNILASMAEKYDSYLFYNKELVFIGWASLITAIATLLIVAVLAWRNGRTWCNTICPVGTILGFFARFSWLKPYIDDTKCVNCGMCARRCKAACINFSEHSIDYSRCVDCMDCLGSCSSNAIKYGRPRKAAPKPDEPQDPARRTFIATTAIVAGAAALKAQEKKVDGGLAIIEDKVVPKRATRIVPPGALSIKNLENRCTACQLCIAACPNDVLRPSNNLATLLQPEVEYEKGYCRPECNKCSQVCPTGAIKPISVEDRASTQVGHAVVIRKNCVVATKQHHCGNCARHCPVNAISMVPLNKDDNSERPLLIPVVNEEKCIGCGACENLCPARPFSAIYVEGHETHRTL